MSSGGKGGKVSADPMLDYANKALDLQKSVYEDNKALQAPYSQAGGSGLNELMTRLGLTGSASYQPTNRDDLYKKLYDSGKYLNNTGDWATTKTDVNALNAEIDRVMAEEAAKVEASKNDPNYGSLLKSFTQEDYVEDPGYQFRLAEGNKALERSLNAAGKTYSPEQVKALQSYGQGLASEEYGNAYNRFNNDNSTIYNRLLGITGLGQTANSALQQGSQNYANQAGELYTGMGNAVTAANVANAQNKGSMFGNLMKAGGLGLQAYSTFSDRRLKTNIKPIGVENGFPIYEFTYREDKDQKKYIGVMADEVLLLDPLAVKMDEESGYHMVDYSKIGVNFREAE